MTSNRIDFTVVMSNFNKAPFLVDSIESVLNQSYDLFQLIIVDDGSTDNSISIINKYASTDGRIRFLSNSSNKGANFSRNRGIEIAKSNYVIIMDSDDLLDRFCLENRMKEINLHLDFDLWIFSMSTFKDDINQIVSTWRTTKGNYLAKFLSHQLPWTISQPVWRRDFLQSLKGFDEAFSRLQDVELHTRALLNNARVYISDNNPDCYYRIIDDRIQNYYSYYEKIAHSVIQYFNIYYGKVLERKYLFLSTLYVIDMIWYGFFSRKLDKREAVLIINEILTSLHIVEDEKWKLRVLKIYWRIKSNFNFNFRGLRFIFANILKSF